MTQNTGTNHTQRALFELRARIVSGELAGGTRLYEVAMAELLSISRTPVREAMSRLAEEGFLERAKGGGFLVRCFTLDDVVDAIELRGILEGTVARRAAEKGVDAASIEAMKRAVDDLDTCFAEIGEQVDFDRYAEMNAKFHDLLAGLCGSQILSRELARTKSLPFASPSAFLPDKLNIQAFSRSLHIAQDQHHALVEAIESREGARAESIAREHARIALGNLEYVLREGGELFRQMPSLAIVVD